MISEIVYQLPLQNLKRVGDKFNFRSNDSCNDGDQRNRQHRGWFYKKDGIWKFKCFNCGNCLNFTTYIKNYFPEFYLDYFKKSFKKDKDFVKLEVDKKLKDELKLYSKFPLITIKNLDHNHKAYQYIKNRKIPEDKLNLLYYSSDFTKFTNQITNDRFKDWKFHDQRIVIPFFTKSKEIFAFQGREIDDGFLRYLTIKLDEDKPKIYGLERIDYTKKIVLCEGPIDSLFISNGLAMAGSDLSEENINKYFSKEQSIILFDLEPRNYVINQKIEKFIKNGYTVSLLPKNLKQYGKDINAIFMNSTLTLEELNSIIHKNVINGKDGLLKFKIWRIQ